MLVCLCIKWTVIEQKVSYKCGLADDDGELKLDMFGTGNR